MLGITFYDIHACVVDYLSDKTDREISALGGDPRDTSVKWQVYSMASG